MRKDKENYVEQLEQVAKSYDWSIECGRKGIDSYDYENLPAELQADPDFPMFQKAREEGGDSDSGGAEIRDFLSPVSGMRFVDLGCCLNLMFRGYDEWSSRYYGVDISGETIRLLERFAAKNGLSVGALHCGSMHETPFEDNFFDIGACIGSLEYFEKDFVEIALREFYRILKPGARFVLDIPDLDADMRRFMGLVEETMGRPDRFDLTVPEFEEMIQPYFAVERTEHFENVAMVQYFLVRKE